MKEKRGVASIGRNAECKDNCSKRADLWKVSCVCLYYSGQWCGQNHRQTVTIGVHALVWGWYISLMVTYMYVVIWCSTCIINVNFVMRISTHYVQGVCIERCERMHTHTHGHTHTNAYTNTHMHTHTHTQTLVGQIRISIVCVLCFLITRQTSLYLHWVMQATKLHSNIPYPCLCCLHNLPIIYVVFVSLVFAGQASYGSAILARQAAHHQMKMRSSQQ